MILSVTVALSVVAVVLSVMVALSVMIGLSKVMVALSVMMLSVLVALPTMVLT